jgi:hypothetical protein
MAARRAGPAALRRARAGGNLYSCAKLTGGPLRPPAAAARHRGSTAMPPQISALYLAAAALLALATAAATAADPRPPAASWLVEIDLAVDGQPPSQRFAHARAGEVVDLAGGSGSDAWTARLTLAPGPQPEQVQVSARIERDGELVAAPGLLAADLQPARVRLDGVDGAPQVDLGVTVETVPTGMGAVAVFEGADGRVVYVLCDGIGEVREAGKDVRLRCRPTD